MEIEIIYALNKLRSVEFVKFDSDSIEVYKNLVISGNLFLFLVFIKTEPKNGYI